MSNNGGNIAGPHERGLTLRDLMAEAEEDR